MTSMAPGTTSLLDRVPFMPETGWDTVRETHLIVGSTAATAEAAAHAHFRRGDRRGMDTLWIAEIQPRRVGPGTFVVTLLLQGLLPGRQVKATWGAAATASSGTNVVVVGGEFAGTWSRVESLEAEPTLTVQYIVVGARPSTAVIAGESEPASELRPEVRASRWISLADPTLHIPNGWVIASRTIEGIAGLVDSPAPWLVSDHYQNIQALTP